MAGKKLREKSGATVLNRQASLNFPTDKNKVASAGIERTKRNIIIDYSCFRFRAVADRVEIEILTEGHTNVQTVQKKLRVILGCQKARTHMCRRWKKVQEEERRFFDFVFMIRRIGSR